MLAFHRWDHSVNAGSENCSSSAHGGSGSCKEVTTEHQECLMAQPDWVAQSHSPGCHRKGKEMLQKNNKVGTTG